MHPLAKCTRLHFGLIAACAAVLATPAHASSVSYYLNQSNEPALPDGTDYLMVTIADDVVAASANGSVITFTVETLASLDPYRGTNFGIQQFGFNISQPGLTLPDSPDSAWILPAGWSADATTPPPNQMDGFGGFDVVVFDGGSARQDPLQFSIDVAGDSIDSYYDPSTGGTGQGNAWFAAHVGFGSGISPGSAMFGAGDGQGGPPSVVPIPAAAWLFGSALFGLAGVARRRNRRCIG